MVFKSNFNPVLPRPPLHHIPNHHNNMHLLNTARDGGSTTTLGSLSQCLTSPHVKKFFLIHKLNLPQYNLKLFPLIPSFVTGEKMPNPTSLLFSGSCRIASGTNAWYKSYYDRKHRKMLFRQISLGFNLLNFHQSKI